ncbi:MAG TPA: hypothetical protein VHW74_12935 [Mycobacteriales bacterium]|jgi:hypothetical protein|nr:hypothetical protein [Mycobacteriales bacterium]
MPIATGTVMLSFMVDLTDVLPRPKHSGGTDVRRARIGIGIDVVTLRDPDGMIVELLNVPGKK